MKLKYKASAWTLLRLALGHIHRNPIILFPTISLAFVQFLSLEILYFGPRFLSDAFVPLIKHVWSDRFLYYPMNLVLLPKMYYYVQVFIYIFLGSFLLGLTARVVVLLNEHSRIRLKIAFRQTVHSYVPILFSFILTFALFQAVSGGYHFWRNEMLKAHAISGSSFLVGKLLMIGETYVQFFMGILITTAMAYVIPIIVTKQVKIVPALLENFRILPRTFITTFLVVVLPTTLYVPVLMIRNNIGSMAKITVPEIQLIIIVVGLLVNMFVDLIIMTAVTSYYLYIKENE